MVPVSPLRCPLWLAPVALILAACAMARRLRRLKAESLAHHEVGVYRVAPARARRQCRDPDRQRRQLANEYAGASRARPDRVVAHRHLRQHR